MGKDFIHPCLHFRLWLGLVKPKEKEDEWVGQQLLVRPNFGSSRLYVEEYVTENDRSPTPSDQRNEQQRR